MNVDYRDEILISDGVTFVNMAIYNYIKDYLLKTKTEDNTATETVDTFGTYHKNYRGHTMFYPNFDDMKIHGIPFIVVEVEPLLNNQETFAYGSTGVGKPRVFYRVGNYYLNAVRDQQAKQDKYAQEFQKTLPPGTKSPPALQESDQEALAETPKQQIAATYTPASVPIAKTSNAAPTAHPSKATPAIHKIEYKTPEPANSTRDKQVPASAKQVPASAKQVPFKKAPAKQVPTSAPVRKAPVKQASVKQASTRQIMPTTKKSIKYRADIPERIPTKILCEIAKKTFEEYNIR